MLQKNSYGIFNCHYFSKSTILSWWWNQFSKLYISDFYKQEDDYSEPLIYDEYVLKIALDFQKRSETYNN